MDHLLRGGLGVAAGSHTWCSSANAANPNPNPNTNTNPNPITLTNLVLLGECGALLPHLCQQRRSHVPPRRQLFADAAQQTHDETMRAVGRRARPLARECDRGERIGH
eukprot:scaffold8685_cov82-Phaeocystis_antarctica.AAC.2